MHVSKFTSYVGIRCMCLRNTSLPIYAEAGISSSSEKQSLPKPSQFINCVALCCDRLRAYVYLCGGCFSGESTVWLFPFIIHILHHKMFLINLHHIGMALPTHQVPLRCVFLVKMNIVSYITAFPITFCDITFCVIESSISMCCYVLALIAFLHSAHTFILMLVLQLQSTQLHFCNQIHDIKMSSTKFMIIDMLCMHSVTSNLQFNKFYKKLKPHIICVYPTSIHLHI